MQYDIYWVKSLSDSDLILCNLLSFMRIYHYNILYDTVRDSVVLEHAEAKHITKVTVKLRTREGKTFIPSPYYIDDDEAVEFVEKLERYYEEHDDG